MVQSGPPIGFSGNARVQALGNEGRITDFERRCLELLQVMVVHGEYSMAAYEGVHRRWAGGARWERAEMAYGAGRLQEATDAYEDLIEVPGSDRWNDAYEPLFHERVAKIYEELGDGAKAAEHYETFAEIWVGADPELQPRVEAARQALDRLRTESASPDGSG